MALRGDPTGPMTTGTVWLADFGNSTLKLRRADATGLLGESLVIPRDALTAWVPSAGLPVADRMIACAGRPGDELLLQSVAEKLCGTRDLFLLTADAPLPFRVRYRSGKPGGDRLANAFALRTMLPGQLSLAVDFGTATNLVVVGPEGDFLGGAILPGIDLQARSLSWATGGRLPEVPITGGKTPAAIGDSTVAAIEAGVLLGTAGAVERLVADVIGPNAQWPGPLLVTGGGASRIAPLLRCTVRIECDLTLLGLREVWRWTQRGSFPAG